MSNLRLINETEITSSVDIVDITDVFSADFDIYCYTLTDFSGSGNATTTRTRFINSSGTVITTSDYAYAFLNMNAGSSFSEVRNASQDNITGFMDSVQNDLTPATTTWIFNPYNSSSYTFGLSQTMSGQNSRAKKAIGVLKETSTITGFRLYTTAGDNLDAGTIRTYGLRVDN